MAVTQNTYTGDGTTVLFSFTFPYLETTDIKVSLDGSITTAYTLANATTIQFNAAPANGVAIRIYRVTDDAALTATFYPGSAIRSQDLNDNFAQVLYKAQEVTNYSIQDVGNVNLVGNYTFNGTASGQAPTASSNFATKQYVDDAAFASGNLTVGNKGDITVNSANSWTLNSTYLVPTDIGVTVQAYDADTAKLDVAQTFTADQTFTATQTYPKVPQNAKTAAYTLVATDAGKHISITTGGITVPSGVFAVGDAISIYNNSGSSQTITQGTSVTLRFAGSALTGNRTLAQYGLCTILCVASNVFVITGTGVS